MADAVSGCCMQRAGAYACSVSGLFSRSRCVRSGRRRTTLVPVLECRFKRRLSGLRQGQWQGWQRLCCWAFRLPGQVAHDDFYLVGLAHLHGYIQERIQQAAFAIADNALYHNAFFPQRCGRLRIGRVGFPLNCHGRQGALAAGVVEDHDAPLVAEIGGIHVRFTGVCGSAHSACVAALLRWRWIALMLHSYCAASCAALCLPSLYSRIANKE